MLKILFNRESLVVRFLELVGIAGSALFLKRKLPAVDVTTGFFLFLLVAYLFVRICAWIRWYPKGERPADGPKRIGIEVHFIKALVPTSYILAITSIIVLLDIPYLSTSIVIFADLLMLVVAPVNGIQIYFHLRDKDPLPINYFSLNKYLNETAQTPSA
jgi:hypothetical protein